MLFFTKIRTLEFRGQLYILNMGNFQKYFYLNLFKKQLDQREKNSNVWLMWLHNNPILRPGVKEIVLSFFEIHQIHYLV